MKKPDMYGWGDFAKAAFEAWWQDAIAGVEFNQAREIAYLEEIVKETELALNQSYELVEELRDEIDELTGAYDLATQAKYKYKEMLDRRCIESSKECEQLRSAWRQSEKRRKAAEAQAKKGSRK